MGVLDTLNSVGMGEDGSVLYPDGFLDSIRADYESEFNGAGAALQVAQAEIAALAQKNTELAAANWNLLQSIPSAATVDEADDDDPVRGDGSESSDDEEPDTEDFFKDKE